MRRVARWVRDNPDAQRQLEEIERSLRPLEDGLVVDEGPSEDLLARTMDSLPPLPAENVLGDNVPGDNFAGELIENQVSLSPVNTHIETRSGRTSKQWDWVGGTVAVAVLLGLLLPSLAEGRFEARKIACQDQLRRNFTMMIQYVMRGTQERLPAVGRRGPEAFAGVYAIRLADAGLLESPESRWCPSLERPVMIPTGIPTGDTVGTSSIVSQPIPMDPLSSESMVSIKQLNEVSVNELRQIQQYAGGNYAYNLGVLEQNRYAPPRYEARATFAVMSDAPVTMHRDGTVSTQSVSHDGRGVNVVYEDGRIQFISIESLGRLPDHPMMNHAGQSEAGVHVDDASLAPSWRPPFVDSPQR